MNFIDPTACDHLFQTWHPSHQEMLQCVKCGQNRAPARGTPQPLKPTRPPKKTRLTGNRDE